MTFDELVADIPRIGKEWHGERIVKNSIQNVPYIRRTIRDIASDTRPALIISAGPSLYRQNSLKSIMENYPLDSDGINIIAADGAYIQCLKAGILPDYVITIDPHPTRIVRWFGDPDYSENSNGDDYFARQDLDITFRNDSVKANAENIRTVDENRVPLIICTASPSNVVARTTPFERYWFAPLVDDPAHAGLTAQICDATGCPSLNTGGTVGTAAWNFGHSVLGSRNIAIVGCDFGYYLDTPLENTQEWNMLKGSEDVEAMFPYMEGHWGTARTSPTYFYYLHGMLDLLESADARIVNCTEGGLLKGDRVDCMRIEEWLTSV